jgi:predicted secreted protein
MLKLYLVGFRLYYTCAVCHKKLDSEELLQKHKEFHYKFVDDWYYLKNDKI